MMPITGLTHETGIHKKTMKLCSAVAMQAPHPSSGPKRSNNQPQTRCLRAEQKGHQPSSSGFPQRGQFVARGYSAVRCGGGTGSFSIGTFRRAPTKPYSERGGGGAKLQISPIIGPRHNSPPPNAPTRSDPGIPMGATKNNIPAPTNGNTRKNIRPNRTRCAR
jgi:hypothetical protein